MQMKLTLPEITNSQVTIRNILNYDMITESTRRQLQRVLEELAILEFSAVRAITPNEDKRGELNFLDDYGEYMIFVYFSGNRIPNVKFLRQVSDMSLTECVNFVDENKKVSFEGNHSEIKRIAFIAGGLGFEYRIIRV